MRDNGRAARSRIRPSRLWEEAVAGLLQRPARSLITSLGTIIAVGSFVTVLGLSATANGQIQQQFDSDEARQITVRLSSDGDWGEGGPSFPADADKRAAMIRGTTAAGVSWAVGAGEPVAVSRLAPGVGISTPTSFPVFAASAGVWELSRPNVMSGRLFDEALDNVPVAVIGSSAARVLGIDSVEDRPTLFIDGKAFAVIGIFRGGAGLASPQTSITIPAGIAKVDFGDPALNASMTVEAAAGAEQRVAGQLPVALDPRFPDNFVAISPPQTAKLRTQISKSVADLILLLGTVFMLVGVVGIANTSLSAALARVPEVALKRSLGALPRHIAAQFIIEFALIGAAGGLIGGFFGTGAIILSALVQQWTPIVQPWVLIAAPFLGAVTGVLASLYSALRATRIEPVEAFRR
jgi:putative ABC transport system permease protein